MSSLISVVCSVSRDLPSVSSFYTPSARAMAQAVLGRVARDEHRGKMPGPKAEVHVGFRINWNDFCFSMNIVQTILYFI